MCPPSADVCCCFLCTPVGCHCGAVCLIVDAPCRVSAVCVVVVRLLLSLPLSLCRFILTPVPLRRGGCLRVCACLSSVRRGESDRRRLLPCPFAHPLLAVRGRIRAHSAPLRVLCARHSARCSDAHASAQGCTGVVSLVASSHSGPLPVSARLLCYPVGGCCSGSSQRRDRGRRRQGRTVSVLDQVSR